MDKFKQLSAPIILIITLVGIVLWNFFFKSVNYYVVSVAILVLSMLPFFISFERKESAAGEISLIATLIALAVVSRAAFYLLPTVKPIAAVVVVSAVCLGAEKGYIVGAFSAFISNFIFGQGFWTPFQMAALGAVGLISGLIFSKWKPKEKTLTFKIALSLVGFILAFAVYGAIVDWATIFMQFGNNITLAGVLTVYASGAPFSLSFGITTAVTLFLFGDVFIRKITRVTTKFGI